MRIGVLGTGMVGAAIATKLIGLGHDVMMGARSAGNEKAEAWRARCGPRASTGTFADAAASGEIVFNCTHGAASLDALRAAGAGALGGKVLVDVANVLPPGSAGPESLGERIQREFPGAKVVKALNTVNCDVMVDPQTVPGAHTLFLCGNDAGAKERVRELLASFGWRDVIDLGAIPAARATEGYLGLWLELWRTLGTAAFNIQVMR